MPSLPTLVLLACIALVVLVLVTTFLRFQLGHGAKTLLRGLGLVLLVVGLYLTHLADLAGNGIRSIYDWAQRTHMGPRLTVGFALAGVGLLFFLIGSVMKTRTREQARTARQTRKGNAPVATAARPGVTGGRSAAKAPAAPVDDEDAEIADILSKRGIN